MIHRLPWVRLPNWWIEQRKLQEFRWGREGGAANLAALMVLTVVCHDADQVTGVAHLTYDKICTRADLSRAMAAAGLNVLEEQGIIERRPEGRSTYGLAAFDPAAGWAQFPARGLYAGGVIQAFRHFKLRQPAELEAMKLYFLFASRRTRADNIARLSYLKIEEYSGVSRNNIRRALSVLAAQGLVHVEHAPSGVSEYGVSSGYRLAHLNTRQHGGTSGRRDVDVYNTFDALAASDTDAKLPF